MSVSVVGVNISKTGNYTILITVSRKTDTGKTLNRWPVLVDHFNECLTNSSIA
ncbi:hypothetical protein OK36_004735 [Salmonella enterica subsp. enterica]|uniref:Uncharacterized protein n=2 Tax=Salmonella enterica TaxID=28901 RepID=A0A743Q7L1_SALER|nr:hypothetical protein [Salmonella enterica subsp. enterica]EDP9083729.1 hypothetical protein [Salmonella enterica subsp. enterica serovar Bareilly]EDP9266625.1 hypothetical protein [Salmonella enterica subsp. houtenae]EDR9815624.1 hypothetical protein [Salmonella enterica subsp. enterica serovar Teko]EDS1492126.1 hypothetical protein [Salmonella enterica subsp. enterica serovar Typhimurium]EDS5840895.1 hypothetical protein [Salmonella enterica subsp. enterica serovar Oslo]EDT2895016.1 hypot